MDLKMRKFNIIFFLIISCFNCNLYSQSGTWRIVDSLKFYIDGAPYPRLFNSIAIDCADTNNCAFAARYGLTYPMTRITSNGGESWKIGMIDSITKGDQDMYIPPNEICYPDTSLCIMICDEGYYFISRDKCRTWEKYRLGKDPLNRISFLNKDVGVINSFYNIYITRDGARSWETYRHDSLNIDTNYLPETTNNVFMLSSDIMFGLFYRQDIKYLVNTIDGGKRWNYISTFPENVQNIFFFDEQTGFVAGRPKVNTGIHKDIIYKTTDGGNSWEIKVDTIIKGKTGISQIYFSDKKNGVALGTGWDLWRTSDGGDSWFQDSSYYNPRFTDYAVDMALLGSTKKFLMINQLNGLVIKYSEDEIINVKEENPTLNSVFRIYPNILNSGESLKIELKENKQGKYKFEIYNSIGSIIDSYEFYSSGDSYTLEYSPPAGIATGQYFVRLNGHERNNYSTTFVIY
jgi:photosystem II stability/assembly factor-like uncharacterized protein